MPVCTSCEYHYLYEFNLTHPKKDSRHNVSECRRNPPVIDKGWPKVGKWDFCGEFEPKPTKEKEKSNDESSY